MSWFFSVKYFYLFMYNLHIVFYIFFQLEAGLPLIIICLVMECFSKWETQLDFVDKVTFLVILILLVKIKSSADFFSERKIISPIP